MFRSSARAVGCCPVLSRGAGSNPPAASIAVHAESCPGRRAPRVVPGTGRSGGTLAGVPKGQLCIGRACQGQAQARTTTPA
jgi:hypothetical protein